MASVGLVLHFKQTLEDNLSLFMHSVSLDFKFKIFLWYIYCSIFLIFHINRGRKWQTQGSLHLEPEKYPRILKQYTFLLVKLNQTFSSFPRNKKDRD